MRGNHITAHDKSKAYRDINIFISISPVVLKIHSHTYCLMIDVVDELLSGLAKNQVKYTDIEMGEKNLFKYHI